MPVIDFDGASPAIDESAFIAPDAWITGKVKLGKNVSVFFGVAARGDINSITVGDNTNLQEHALLHTSHGLGDCVIEDSVTVGHRATVHGAHIESHCIIGMGATVLDGARIGKHSIIGAQSLVPMNMEIPPGSLALGVPAKVVRKLRDEEIEETKRSAAHYVEVGQKYKKSIYPKP